MSTNSGSSNNPGGGGGSGGGGGPSPPTTSSSKKAKQQQRKTSIDSNKPQSQINKCLNEKRRREQENIYIEELAELISVSIADMSALSVKPDKCAILQETVNQIRRIKAEEESLAGNSTNYGNEDLKSVLSPQQSTSNQQIVQQQQQQRCDVVQQGEVSSSTTILANEILCPLVLEALDGFLFVVNSDGRIEYVSENVTTFIGFLQSELQGDNIYNIIPQSDHQRFGASLLPGNTTNTGSPWQQSQQQDPFSPSTNSAVFSPGNANNSSSQPSTPNAGVAMATGQQSAQQPPQKSTQQRSFNIRLLTKSQAYENMQISSILTPHPGLEENCLVCIARRLPPNERLPGSIPVQQFTTKLLTDGRLVGVDTSGLSGGYRTFIGKELVGTLLQDLVSPPDLQKLNTHLKETLQQGSSTSQLYKLQLNAEKFVQVQTKSKYFSFNSNNEPDFIMATHTIVGERPQQQQQQDSNSVSSPSNNVATPSPPNKSTTSTSSNLLYMINQGDSNNNSGADDFTTFSLHSDYEFDFQWPGASSGAASGGGGGGGPGGSGPAGGAGQNSVPMDEDLLNSSPLQPNIAATWGVQQEDGEMILGGVGTPPPSQLGGQGSQGAGPSNPQQSNPTKSGNPGDRLRILLTNKQENKILKGLLNQEDENGQLSPGVGGGPGTPTTPGGGPGAQGGEHNMLLKLLNDKSTQDHTESRRGTELLQQLLNSQDPNDNSQQSGLNQEALRGFKRTAHEMMLDRMPVAVLRQQQLQQRPQNARELCERNPRLVQLLAKQPEPAVAIPQIPSSMISASPQERLKQLKSSQGQGVGGPPPPNIPLSMQQSYIQQQQQQQAAAVAAANSDDLLSTILDQVIDFVPDISGGYQQGGAGGGGSSDMMMGGGQGSNLLQNYNPHDESLMNLLGGGDRNADNELDMINAIQRELMQFEQHVNYSPQSQSQQFLPQQQQQQQQQQLVRQQMPMTRPPMYIQRTTTTTTTMIRPPPNIQLPPSNAVNQQQQQLLLIQQKRRLLQQQQLLREQAGGVRIQQQGINNLSALLNSGGAPNVTLPTNQQQQGQQMQMMQQQNVRQHQSLPPQQQQLLLQRQNSLPNNSGGRVANYPQQQQQIIQQQQQRLMWQQANTGQPLRTNSQPSSPLPQQQQQQLGNLVGRNPMLNEQLGGQPPPAYQLQSPPGGRQAFQFVEQQQHYSSNRPQQQQMIVRNQLLMQGQQGQQGGGQGQQQGGQGSDFVRQELRSLVETRNSPQQQQQQQQQQSSSSNVTNLIGNMSVPDFEAIWP